jgi:multidrug efflux pump subunit AcrB
VVGGSLVEGTEDLPVRVRLPAGDRGAVGDLAGRSLLAPDAPAIAATGGWPGIPVTAVGTLSLDPADSPIARRNGERVNVVQGFLRFGVLPEEALADVRTRLDAAPLALPPGYRLEVGGDADARSETVGNLVSTLGLVVTLTVAAIVLTFRRFRLALITVMVAGLSMGLSLLALAVFDYPFGIQALIGVIGSIGVSINAAIIIMTALQADPEALAGDVERMRAIVAGSGRHILSTTLTTFGGFLPLILEGGGFWPPFAMAIAGGVLLSSVVSFYFTPPMVRLLMGRRALRHARSGPLGAGTPASVVPRRAVP